MKQLALSGFDCEPRLSVREGEATEEQLQQQQRIVLQSVINISMRVLMDSMKQSAMREQQQQQQSIVLQSVIDICRRVLMDSMKQSAMSHKLIKHIPISLSYKELACLLTYGLSTSSSSSSTLKCASTKQPVVKAKRYSNLYKKCNTKIQLPVMKRISPFFTTTMDAHMPSESTIIAPTTRSFLTNNVVAHLRDH